MNVQQIESLVNLARLAGVETSYASNSGKTVEADPAAIVALLTSLGHGPLESQAQIARARDKIIRKQKAALFSKKTLVIWQGEKTILSLNREAIGSKIKALVLSITDEEGHKVLSKSYRLTPAKGAAQLELAVGRRLNPGYYQVLIRAGRHKFSCHLIVSPEKCYFPPTKQNLWGPFVPLYSLSSKNSWGIGDYTDLARVAQWADQQGAGFLGILPILAQSYEAPHVQYSPYSPMSRLFWNEIFLDIPNLPEFEQSPKAAALVAQRSFQTRLDAARISPQVQYAEVYALKKSVLVELAKVFFKNIKKTPRSDRAKKYRQFLNDTPFVEAYARFRKDEKTHLYAQFCVHEALTAIGSKIKPVGLYLDLALGVENGGFDPKLDPKLFVPGTCVGAPPDETFTKGQDWGFAPMHPERVAETGYEYFKNCVRAHLKKCGALRLDHILGLMRLYCIPKGFGPSQGVYLQYDPEPFFAVLALESHRARGIVVGEDLGTVPPMIRDLMTRRGVLRLYVAQFSVDTKKGVLNPPPQDSLACVNTHDLPLFSSYWNESDIPDRISLGYLNEAKEPKERAERARAREVISKTVKNHTVLKPPTAELYRHLLGQDSKLKVVTLEDLWGEERPQNIPGTTAESRPNWIRKAKRSVEEICAMDLRSLASKSDT